MTKKISQLPAATSVDTNDEFVINQDGTTKKLTTANQWDFANVNIDGGTIDGTAVNATTLTASGDVNFDSGTLFVDASANAVGIGTTSPSELLSLSSSNATLSITRPGTDGIGIGVDPAGPYLRGGASIQFQTASTERMRIDSSGNVGIGTTSPDAKLHATSSNGKVLRIRNNHYQVHDTREITSGTVNFLAIDIPAPVGALSVTVTSGILAPGSDRYERVENLFITKNSANIITVTSIASQGDPAANTVGTSISGTVVNFFYTHISNTQTCNSYISIEGISISGGEQPFTVTRL